MKELKEDDIVTFKVGDKVHKYMVNRTFLNYIGGDSNYRIFHELGMENYDEIHQFASKEYGYKSTHGDWPEYKSGDYAAAFRLVKNLWELCNVYNSLQKIHEDEKIPF